MEPVLHGGQLPCFNTDMKPKRYLAWAVLFGASTVLTTPAANCQTSTAENYSGMYTFLKEGEFLQITVEDAGIVTGFVSRYADDGGRRAFLDQFFKEGKLDGVKLTFVTETSHAVWYEFRGAFEHGSGKTPAEEAYHVLKGTLIEYREDATRKTSAKTSDVTFKSFPKDLD
jgi:hypothetical protein